MSDPRSDLEVTQSSNLASLVEWTPQQQIEALKTRFIKPDFVKPSLVTRPSDVIVAVPAKCGTTWILHICHQLRMQGAEPDFEEQWKVCPWIEMGMKFYEKDPSTQIQPADPRVFKTHLPYSLVPKDVKLIYCFRDGKDSMLSSYNFLDSIMSLRGRVSLPIYFKFITQMGFFDIMLQDLLNWWEHRHDDNVLLLFFDDLKEDHVGCVRRIAKFVGIECSENVIERVVHTTTHTEMARHHSKFDESFVTKKIAKMFGEEPPTNFVGKVRKDGGRSGDGQKLLPQEVQDFIGEKWKEIITAKLGFKDLNEMRNSWNKERKL